jgi:hypothetical protein
MGTTSALVIGLCPSITSSVCIVSIASCEIQNSKHYVTDSEKIL